VSNDETVDAVDGDNDGYRVDGRNVVGDNGLVVGVAGGEVDVGDLVSSIDFVGRGVGLLVVGGEIIAGIVDGGLVTANDLSAVGVRVDASLSGLDGDNDGAPHFPDPQTLPTTAPTTTAINMMTRADLITFLETLKNDPLSSTR
jgi:hypothetical protein